MADDPTPRPPTPTTASVTAETVPFTAPATTTAPAVHGSELWGGPQFIATATANPVWVETKADYWNLLNQTGFRMKEQQESVTGPEQPFKPWHEPAPVIAERPTPPFRREDAEAICAASAVWLTHGIGQTFWCPQCFALGRAHGTRVLIRSSIVRIECRCGAQAYRPSPGATELPTKLANVTHTSYDHASGVLAVGADRRAVPTTELHRQECRAIRAYIAVLERYGLQARLFCETCWNHTSFDEDFAMQIAIDSGKIALACTCRMFYGSDAQ